MNKIKQLLIRFGVFITSLSTIRVGTALFMLATLAVYTFYEELHMFLVIRIISYGLIIALAGLMYVMGWARSCNDANKKENGTKKPSQ